jgi:gliding motility associated protien GldN
MHIFLPWRRGCALVVAFVATYTLMAQPLDDVVNRNIQQETQPMVYSPIREADILWEKRIWQVIDTREKMNLGFRNPQMPLYTLLEKAIRKGEITAFSTIDDHFSTVMDTSEFYKLLTRTDTVIVIDPVNGVEHLQIVNSDFDPESVVRYRLKEMWYFDKQRSTLRVQILGIAPVVVRKDEKTGVEFEKPLFWVYYPACRKLLSQYQAPVGNNMESRMSWEDIFEMRMFTSTITKESNIHDRRLEDYLAGTPRMQESSNIKQETFNKEHDVWSH